MRITLGHRLRIKNLGSLVVEVHLPAPPDLVFLGFNFRDQICGWILPVFFERELEAVVTTVGPVDIGLLWPNDENGAVDFVHHR